MCTGWTSNSVWYYSMRWISTWYLTQTIKINNVLHIPNQYPCSVEALQFQGCIPAVIQNTWNVGLATIFIRRNSFRKWCGKDREQTQKPTECPRFHAPELGLQQLWFSFIPWSEIFRYGLGEECRYRKSQCIPRGGVRVGMFYFVGGKPLYFSSNWKIRGYSLLHYHCLFLGPVYVYIDWYWPFAVCFLNLLNPWFYIITHCLLLNCQLLFHMFSQ